MDKIFEFTKMVNAHNLTYMYSDSGQVLQHGDESLDKIKDYARKNLDRKTAVKIWNEIVDRKIAEGFRDSFYWKE